MKLHNTDAKRIEKKTIQNEVSNEKILNEKILNEKISNEKVGQSERISNNTSQKELIKNDVIEKSKLQKEFYKAAIYLRLSKDYGEENESQSIENQRELCRQYADQHGGIKVVIELIDDGYSGVTFERPAFTIMMNLMKSGKINCILVKDLSRLGRNFVEVGELIERIFPRYQVRFIAINDNYDSKELGGQYDYLLYSFKNLLNEVYSQDISTKTKSHLNVKRKNGDFVGSFASYGYQKSSTNKNQLVVDAYAADVVKDIFQLKMNGMSQGRIAEQLNHLGILSPGAYKKIRGQNFVSGFQKNNNCLWTPTAVTRILKNEIYIGNLIQGKETKLNIKRKKRIRRKESDWVKASNTHEAIISKEEFQIVKQLLNSDTRVSPNNNELYLLSGLIYCNDCGQNLIRKKTISKNRVYIYYVCSTNKRDKSCKSHRIKEEKVTQTISAILKQYLSIQESKAGEEINNKFAYTSLIEKVYIYDKERLEVIFRFHDILKGDDYYS